MIKKNKIKRSNTSDLLKYRKYKKHPNDEKFFLKILDDVSPLPYFYWWSNIPFVIICIFLFNKKYEGVTYLSKSVMTNFYAKVVYDAMAIWMLIIMVPLTLLTLKGVSYSTKKNIVNGISWSKEAGVFNDIEENQQLKRFSKFLLCFAYLFIAITWFFTNDEKLIPDNLLNNFIFNFLLIEIIYIAILVIVTCYLISKEL